MRERYYQEEEVSRLIENLAQWAGDGAAVSSSISLWGRLLRELRRGSAPVVTIGIDAGYAQVALKLIGDELSDALMTFHLSPLTIELQARQVLHIAKSTYYRRLEVGHVAFMASYREQRRATKL